MTSASSFVSSVRAVALLSALLAASFAHAQTQFQVQLDTSTLISNPAAPFYLDFQLNDGAGLGNGNSFATLSNFDFGGGSSWGAATTSGGAMGNLSTSVSIVDTDAMLNEFYQGFTAGSWLKFTVSLSPTVEWGPVPDKFTFAILDKSLFNLPTQSLGTDAFVEVNLDSAHPALFSYGSADMTIAAPTLTPVPEPSTYGLMGAALLGLLVWRKRLKR